MVTEHVRSTSTEPVAAGAVLHHMLFTMALGTGFFALSDANIARLIHIISKLIFGNLNAFTQAFVAGDLSKTMT